MKNKLSFLIFFLLVFLVLGNLIVSNQLSTDGEKTKALELEKEKLKAENSLIELKIAQLGSISRVLKRARELGFAYSPKVLYLRPEVPVAMR